MMDSMRTGEKQDETEMEKSPVPTGQLKCNESEREQASAANPKPAQQITAIDSQQQQRNKEQTQLAANTTTTTETTTETAGGQYSDQVNVDAECDRLLRNAKKQVKQMMEEAVTKKFIHEESSSIISLCVAIDACLSHGLKRRALGLFKSNSSTALVNKIAKSCPAAQEIQTLVEEEEKRQLADEQQLQKQLQASNAQLDGNNNNKLQHQTSHQLTSRHSGNKIVLASNLSVHRRNLWIKFALIEKKLVEIVEFLAENASKYYESEALMANYLSAQILCSLLVGPCALEFSRSKTNDCYQFDEPNAEELLKRHKLSNPIACLCPPSRIHNHHQQQLQASDIEQQLQHRNDSNPRAPSSWFPVDNNGNKHTQLARSITHSGSSSPRNAELVADQQLPPACQRAADGRRRRATAGQAVLSTGSNENQHGQHRADSPTQLNCTEIDGDKQHQQQSSNDHGEPKSPSAATCSQLFRSGSRRKPLALKTNVKTGALVTECHHYSCQEISEHQQTRGYSFKCSQDLAGSAVNSSGGNQLANTVGMAANMQANGQQQESLSVWSPRMLHEILHQNSKSSLLYAKNNVLLETQAHELMAGYLSLHQTSADLILKWIPNQMINGQTSAPQVPSLSGCCDHSTGETDNNNDEQQLATQRRSKSEDLLEQRSTLNMTNCPENQDTPHATAPVGSSYLDLVVSLSVSRIVLLHCQFGNSCSLVAHDGQNESADGTAPSARVDRSTSPVANSSSSNSNNNYEETLILVEVDGVQRAPFKFPKGGLRWFLSCLENGLFPNKYLDPTICSDSLLSNDASLINNWLTNPMKSQPHMQEAPDDPNQQASDSPPVAATNASEMATATSRLDSLLRRLPALKRALKSDDLAAKLQHQTTTAETASSPTPSAATNSQANSRTTSPTMRQDKQTTSSAKTKTPVNYVFRIVSVQQQPADWRLQTPPNSAFSVGSSSSGSFALISSGHNQAIRQHSNGDTTTSEQQQQQLQESAKLEQRRQQSRWSLSRWTRFSSGRNNQSGCSTSSSSLGGLMSNFGRANKPGSSSGSFNWSILDGNRNSKTNDSMNNESLDGISLDPNGCCSGSIDSPLVPNNAADRNKQSTRGSNSNSSREFVRIEAKLSDLKKSSSDELVALRNQSIQTLCESMRRQILARAFYGWLAYCRRTKIIRTHLTKLIRWEGDNYLLDEFSYPDEHLEAQMGLTHEKWDQLLTEAEANSEKQLSESQLSCRVNQLVYYGGIESNELRTKVWPYMLGHYKFTDSKEEQAAKDKLIGEAYKRSMAEWTKIERVVKQRDNEILAANMAKVARKNCRSAGGGQKESKSSSLSDDTTTANHRRGNQMRRKEKGTTRTMSETINGPEVEQESCCDVVDLEDDDETAEGEEEVEEEEDLEEEEDESALEDNNELAEDNQRPPEGTALDGAEDTAASNSVQNPNQAEHESADSTTNKTAKGQERKRKANKVNIKSSKSNTRNSACGRRKRRFRLESTGSVGSDASVTDRFGNNIHRIDKDVQRCDRNFWYFKDLKNLDKLHNVMCNYVWQHLDVGYVQGMCDLAAPFLVIFDDETLAFTCFNHLMTRMVANFPHGCAMDQHFESLKYLMQVLDPKLFEVLQDDGDNTHFYFCYRWLLLDFKRELAYEDVYRVWETIWAARHVVTDHFVVFLALAMVRYYRDIIIENNMDFTDTIKFFNEMAERHDARKIIALARDSVVELESLIMSC